MKLRTKDLLTFAELSAEETEYLLDAAAILKRDLKMGRLKPLLRGKTLAMIFQKPSTRTRVSFETGMYQLGGNAVVLSSSEMQLSRGETMADTAKTLSGYVDCIMARVFAHETVEQLASCSRVPVINGLSDSFHPCQTLADLLTIREMKGFLAGLQVAWVGDGNNVCNSLILGCARTRMNIAIATPEEFGPDQNVVDSVQEVEVQLTTDPTEAVRGADVVMTDTFLSIHNADPERSAKFLPMFQVSRDLMAKAKPNAIFLHCLPAKRGQEVTPEVIDGPQSAVWDEAENRLHTQKALLLLLLQNRLEDGCTTA